MSEKIASLYAEITADTTKLQAGLKESKGGLDGLKANFMAAAKAAGILTAASFLVKKGLDETVGVFIKYANEVRTLSQVTGASAQQTSRLIQLADDHKVSVQNLTTAMRTMSTQGHAVTIESLGKMSDEYLKLNPGIERQQYLMQNFGRAGIEFAEMMLMGSDAIKQESGAISQNLVLSEKALKQARENEIAQDNLNDAWMGLKVTIGEHLTPALTGLINGLNGMPDPESLAGKWNAWNEEIKETAGNVSLLYKILNQPPKSVLGGRGSMLPYEEFRTGITELTEAVRDYGAELNDVTSFADVYRIGIEDTSTAVENLRDAQDELVALQKAGWGDSSVQIKDAKDKVNDMAEKLREAQKASKDATNEMIAGFLQTQLTLDGTFDEADMQRVLDYRLAVGLLTDEEYEAALQAMAIATGLASIPATVTSVVSIYQTTFSRTVSASTGDEGLPSMPDPGDPYDEAGWGSGSEDGPAATGGPRKGLFLTGDPGPMEELVYAPAGAYIYTASQTRQLRRKGALKGVPGFMRGGNVPFSEPGDVYNPTFMIPGQDYGGPMTAQTSQIIEGMYPGGFPLTMPSGAYTTGIPTFTPSGGGGGGGGASSPYTAPTSTRPVDTAVFQTINAVSSVGEAARQISASGEETTKATRQAAQIAQMGEQQLINEVRALRNDIKRLVSAMPRQMAQAVSKNL